MSDYNAVVSQGMREKPVIGNLRKGNDGSWFVVTAACQIAHGSQSWYNLGIWFQ